MVYVYVIESQATGRRYVGIAEDVPRRLKEHNAGRSKSTRPYCPWVLVYQEEHEAHEAARAREKYLKTSAGRRYLKKLLDKG
ncbi:MAG: GIY-YIG nuclease family protein [Phaeodactylibacter sp.]|nr:GIY-YIG nuclease family protein [Phaeodactylibacter sp.]